MNFLPSLVSIDRSPPCDLEAERATLGAVLLNRDAITALDGWLLPEHFYLERHAWVYAAALACYHKRVPPDTSTVSDELRRAGRLDVAGGLMELLDLVNATPTSAHVEYYGRIVERCATMRGLIAAGGKITALGYDEDQELAETLNRAEAELLRVSMRRGAADYRPISALADETWQQLDRRAAGEVTGVSTGYTDLDVQLCGGLHKSDLVILAARPAVGKSSLAMGIALNAARNAAKVGVVSLEMARQQLMERLLAMATGVDLSSLREGRLGESDLRRTAAALGEISSLPLWIDDTAGQRFADVRSRARRLHAAVGLDLLIVDYLQLLQGGSDPRYEVQELSAISAGLKNLARELDIPVLALAQLSRAVEGRQSHVPMLSDLRGSGSIEQDADIVMFIYRDELYDKETEKRGIAEIHIAKHRNGPTGVVPLRFNAVTTGFQNLATSYKAVDGY